MKIEDLKVLYEDNHLIVVWKPASVLVQADSSGQECLMDFVKDYLKSKYDKPGDVFLGLLHRLDRPVSGIVLFAKTSKGASRLSAQIRNRDLEKIYHAWVCGEISGNEKGIEKDKESSKEVFVLKNFLIKDKIKLKSEVILNGESNPDAKYAELSFEKIKYDKENDKTLVKIFLKTGRFHQIRAQLSHIGHPICGDFKYGAKEKYNDGHIDLSATSLTFSTATTGEMKTIDVDCANVFL